MYEQSELHTAGQTLEQKKPAKQPMNLTLKKWLFFFSLFLACVATFFLFYRLQDIYNYIAGVLSALAPIFYGFIIAYLLNGPMMFFRRRFYAMFSKKNMTDAKARKLAKGLSVATAVLLAVLIIVGVCFLMIPQLFRSIVQLVEVVPQQLENLMQTAEEHKDSDNAAVRYLVETFYTVVRTVRTWFSEMEFSSKLGEIVSMLTSYLQKIANVILNAVVAIIVSIYILIDKERFCGQAKKLLYAVMPAKRVNSVLKTARHAHSIFGKFMVGVLVDALVVGTITFITMAIAGVPYSLLIGVIVGLTNVIPFFGPFIGAIPSAILIFIMAPGKVLFFIVFIIVLQQIDGNVLNPMIVGDSTGVSEFWVMFSLLLFGNIFGVFGMVIAVPLFAVIANLVRILLNRHLEKKNLPIDSQKYEAVVSYDDKQKVFVYDCKDDFLVYPKGEKLEGDIEYHVVHRRKPKTDEIPTVHE